MKLTAQAPLLHVFDMERSLSFYRDILGFEVQGSWAPEGHLYWVDLRQGNVAIMLNAKYEIAEQPASDDPASAGWHHDTVLCLNTDNVDAAYEELRSRVPELQPPTTAFYGMRCALAACASSRAL